MNFVEDGVFKERWRRSMLYAVIGKREVDYSSLELGFFKLGGPREEKKG